MSNAANASATLDDVVVQLKINNCLLAAQLLKSTEEIAYHDLVMLLAGTGAG